VPRPIQYSSAGKLYLGQVGPGTRGWQVTNGVPASNYLSAGGTHQVPDDAYISSGVWNNDIEADAGVNAIVRAHCNLHGCNRWDSSYHLFDLDSAAGEDFLNFDPNGHSVSWDLAGTFFTFAPSGFYVGTINVGTLNATTINGGVNASAISSGTINAARLPVFGPSGTTHAAGAVPDPGATAGAIRYLREDGTWATPASGASSGSFATLTESSSDPNGTVLQMINTSGNGSQYNIEVAGSAASFPNNGLIYHDAGFGNYPFWYSGGSNAGIWTIAHGLFGWSSNGTDPRANGASGFDTAIFRQSAGVVCASANPLSASCNGEFAGAAFHETLTTPASSSAACSAGDFTDDANYHYVCVAANTWKRVALSTF
jgi:hypothetical protein